MFNRDALFGKKDEAQRNEPRSSVNVTPSLGAMTPPPRPQPAAEAAKPDLRFSEIQKAPPSQPQPQPPIQPTQEVEEPGGSRLIVGPDIKLKGVEITDCDTLVVEGRVEASMDSRVIQIAERGVFSGTVSIDIAEIRGRFEGQLTARKQLVIYSTGRVSGEIRYGKIRIEEGGEVSGQISTLAQGSITTSAAAAAATPTPPVNPAPSTLTGSAASAAPAAAAPSPSAASTPQAPAAAQRSPQPAALILGDTPQPSNSAANREPPPSRSPKGGKSSAATV